MSFLSGAIHAVGDVAAPIMQGAGAVIPGSEGNRLSSIGSAIASPNQVLSNPGGVLAGSKVSSFTPVSGGTSSSAGTPTPQRPLGQTASPNNSAILAGGTSGSGANVNAINSAYDTLSNYYRGLMPTADNSQQIGENQTNAQYNDNLQSLTDQRNSAFANLDNQTGVVNQSYQKSLQQLGNSIRNTMQGQTNALGVGGAGDSSATYMLAHALSDLQNQNRGYMNQDMNNQLNQIGLSRTADTNQFNDQAQTLADWRTQQLQDVAQQHAQLVQQINEKLAGNEQYRQLALNNAGQWASGQAQSIDSTLQNSLDTMNKQYQGMLAPSTSMGNLPQYQAQAINAPTVAASGPMQQTTTPQDVMQYIAPQSFKDQNQQPSF